MPTPVLSSLYPDPNDTYNIGHAVGNYALIYSNCVCHAVWQWVLWVLVPRHNDEFLKNYQSNLNETLCINILYSTAYSWWHCQCKN